MTQVTRLTLGSDGNLGREQVHLSDAAEELEAPLKTVGQDLRAAREARGLDLTTVSKALKIRKEHLEAMEADRIEALPGRTYAVGFLRSYAAYLGLDPVLYVDRFKSEIAGRGDVVAPRVTEVEGEDARALPQGWWILAAVVLLLVCYGAYQLLSASDRQIRDQSMAEPMSVEPVHPAPASPPPASSAQTAADQTAADQTAAGQTPAGQTPAGQTPAGQEAGIQNGVSGAPAQSSSAPGANTPSGAAAAVTSPAVGDGGVTPGHMVYGQHNPNSRVLLKVAQPTKVTVVGPDGTLYIGRMLYPGDVYHLPNLPGLTLSAEDAGALQVTLDGKSVGALGSAGAALDAVAISPDALARRRHH